MDGVCVPAVPGVADGVVVETTVGEYLRRDEGERQRQPWDHSAVGRRRLDRGYVAEPQVGESSSADSYKCTGEYLVQR